MKTAIKIESGAIQSPTMDTAQKIAKVKKQPPDLTAGEFNRMEC